MSTIIYPNGTAKFTIPANESIAVFTASTAVVSRILSFPNYPAATSVLGTVTAGQTVFGPYSTGATIVVDAGPSEAFAAVGVAPAASEYVPTRTQPDPVAVNATGAVSAAAMIGGIVTSTTAAAVAGTVPTGAVLDLAGQFAVNDSFEWSVIVTGATNAFTVTAATGHTLVGNAVVAASSSGRFLTRKTAVDTFITYRI